jgi:3-deoxy-manno-octulosonate cytidylyltransferase (CMP-KDO synthetase)
MTASGFIAVIPARYASTRLPGQPLKDIAGKPMIEWVYRQALKSGAADVIVATDDERIAAACRGFAARVELTSAAHESGTDRIAEIAWRFGWADDQIVVNVQGDEPLISPLCIAQTARLLSEHTGATIATLTTPLESEAEFRDANFAKVVTDKDGWALYFSRAPIPWPRDGGMPAVQRHIGLYAYRVAGLKTITAAPPCVLEQVEKLEQLRALWLGLRIIVATAAEPPSPAVDTEEDLQRVRRYLERSPRALA